VGADESYKTLFSVPLSGLSAIHVIGQYYHLLFTLCKAFESEPAQQTANGPGRKLATDGAVRTLRTQFFWGCPAATIIKCIIAAFMHDK
jgi:hypothetical protein